MKRSNKLNLAFLGLSGAFLCTALLMSNNIICAKADTTVYEPLPQEYKYDSATAYSNDIVVGYEECTYDEKGDLDTQSSYYIDETSGEKSLHYVFKYDFVNGLCTYEEETYYNEEGSINFVNYYKYSFNERGDETYFEMGQIIDGEYVLDEDPSYITYTYDSNDRISQVIRSNGGDENRKDIYTYDDNGYTVDNYLYGSFNYSCRYDTNSKGLVVRESTYNTLDHTGNETSIRTYEYDSNDRLIKDADISVDDAKITRQQVYSYLKNTNFITETTRTRFSNNGNYSEDTVKCTYDEFDRIIKFEEFEEDYDAQKGEKTNYRYFGYIEYSYNSDPTPEPTPNPSPNNHELGVGGIIGITLGSILGIILIFIIVTYIFWKKKNFIIPLVGKILVPVYRGINKLLFKTKLNDVEKEEEEQKQVEEVKQESISEENK